MKKEEENRGGLDLRGINEAEIASYIRNKKELQFRTVLWELLNGDHSNQNPTKKSSSRPKKKIAALPPKKPNFKDNKKKTSVKSSKVNYDALKKILDDDDEHQCTGGAGDANSNSNNNTTTGDQFHDHNRQEDDGYRYTDVDHDDFEF
ncbi:rhoGEF domain-containing protein gxcH [Ricinus communis]|uniref:Brf1 TBP-binding domain-containing protein n=1 Tax=Ricinus communis TaxID=3988 RepID=B9SDD1_RICCO|nr:rhoGEF domain-containing protein gxcH [Ricinus communis]EEF38368.1 conserved hypothetical protein [Ricinus communis]|eukprot:XP_002524000.1 rhoGEF domain-containing protein gxcH [Ricinus communis]